MWTPKSFQEPTHMDLFSKSSRVRLHIFIFKIVKEASTVTAAYVVSKDCDFSDTKEVVFLNNYIRTSGGKWIRGVFLRAKCANKPM